MLRWWIRRSSKLGLLRHDTSSNGSFLQGATSFTSTGDRHDCRNSHTDGDDFASQDRDGSWYATTIQDSFAFAFILLALEAEDAATFGNSSNPGQDEAWHSQQIDQTHWGKVAVRLDDFCSNLFQGIVSLKLCTL